MTSLSKALRYIQDSPARHAWQTVGILPKHGICVPLFSLHTENSCGIGEFLDLIPLIEWCKQHKFQIIQLLPLNDTGEDTSPYNSISSVALNPMHLSLTALPYVQDVSYANIKLKRMQQLCSLPYVHYHAVKTAKWDFLRSYYRLAKARKLNYEQFEIFKEKERYWLAPYCLFRTIKARLHGAPINTWPTHFTDINNFAQLQERFSEDTTFFAYLQYLCFEQMIQVRKCADSEKILLMGDLPILISKDSCDVWYHRSFFCSSNSVGAPPDLYNHAGQNWHLPVYNRDNLAKDSYKWWKSRLRYAENFYSLYRIDHIVGLFRLWIWDKKGNGRFDPEHPKDYLPQGIDLLSQLLRSSRMLPIGEDLGSIPDDIKKNLEQLAVCGTRIPRWERRWSEDGGFIPMDQYSPLSVTALSTHDSDTLSLWWRHSPSEARLFAKFLDIPFSHTLSAEHQAYILQCSHHSSSIFHINLLNDYLAMCPDLVSKDLKYERINLPGKVSKNNWVYRVKPSLKEMAKHEALNTYINYILSNS
ncbi:4-alpha-glucanotransferase [Chlamydia ibidis]|uniref:4-alpha-glucanotransferase n=2 Tax=Chlamydia ibidis TaxID=1405396 RepID=S7J684_9CHLA|nr:4-alpha-glucanotransferase [Chlamydia ibidis]EPP35672.1 4-alpha-glucanotransferase [Chlamydia ibidis]EQM62668.1 4-alpha-glucanotransferase [Chlamydia ibidis 10-1398/6]